MCMGMVSKGGPPNHVKNHTEWQLKVDQGPATWKVVHVARRRRWPSSKDETLSPATAAKGESSINLAH